MTKSPPSLSTSFKESVEIVDPAKLQEIRLPSSFITTCTIRLREREREREIRRDMRRRKEDEEELKVTTCVFNLTEGHSQIKGDR